MATDKKHIAVYLDKAVEDALNEFCIANSMESKKGPMYSAAVNKALAQFFGIPSTTPDTILSATRDTIPGNKVAQRLAELENQLSERFEEIEERLGKLRA
ncbi:hypothetical protein K4039_27220 [Lyngbya sp. CCAP 1446/10]|uniref:hypothetical protein n=1 Tax=Lyngbya sp. CCAP 1446/10 TaxID=439293 RepID=UPI0022381B37|nr:hypothetical protein [Lyngbya sp. CCAP 1446/10]MCW6053641.1 hypothetical protein [Lyngbya sp. CCAP 1446/10]